MANVKKINHKDQIYIFTKSGEVVGHNSWSETHVSGHSSGGGGYIQDGAGHVSSPTITVSSKINEKQRIFLKLTDKSEIEIEEINLGFGVRDGHRITAIYVGNKESESGYPMAIINHSTGKEKIFYNRASWLVEKQDALSGCLMVFFLPILPPILLVFCIIIIAIFLPNVLIENFPPILEGDLGNTIALLSTIIIWLGGVFFILIRIGLKSRKTNKLIFDVMKSLENAVSDIRNSTT